MGKSEKLQNWKKINVEEIIEDLDIEEIHRLSVFSDYGTSILIWADGEVSTLEQGTTPNTDTWYAVIKAEGRGNIIVDDYADGWAEEETDEYGCSTGNYIETETGKVMTDDEMISECIETGHFPEYESYIEDQVREQYEEDIQNLEGMIDQDI